MSIENDLSAALGPLVSSRCYPQIFPQAPIVPVWPAIRFTFVSSDPGADACGDGGPELSDTRVQIDVVAKTFDAMRTLRLQVLTAMQSFTPPAIWSGAFEEYDSETKTHRCALDFVIYPSSA